MKLEFCQIKGNSLHFLNILIVYVQESSDRDGEKYCIHCRTILSKEFRCSVCGKEEFQNIIIQVQNQSSVKKEE